MKVAHRMAKDTLASLEKALADLDGKLVSIDKEDPVRKVLLAGRDAAQEAADGSLPGALEALGISGAALRELGNRALERLDLLDAWNALTDRRRAIRDADRAQARADALAELAALADDRLQAERDKVYARFVEAKEQLRRFTLELDRRQTLVDAEAAIAGLSDTAREALRQSLSLDGNGIPSREEHGFGAGR